MTSDFSSDCGFFADAIETLSYWPRTLSGTADQREKEVAERAAETRNNLELVTRDLRAAEDYFEDSAEKSYDRFFDPSRGTDLATAEFFKILSYVGVLVVGIPQEVYYINAKRLQSVVDWYRGVIKDAGTDGERFERSINRFINAQEQLVATLQAVVSSASGSEVKDCRILGVFNVIDATTMNTLYEKSLGAPTSEASEASVLGTSANSRLPADSAMHEVRSIKFHPDVSFRHYSSEEGVPGDDTSCESYLATFIQGTEGLINEVTSKRVPRGGD